MDSIGATRLDSMVSYVFDVPVTIHVLRMSNGSGGISIGRVSDAMDDLNAQYAGTAVQFEQVGQIRYIDNDAMYNDTDTQAEINAIANTDVVADTLNVYFCNNLRVEGRKKDDPPVTLCGQASFTGNREYQAVLIDNGCAGNGSTFAHEVGHFFNLYHTHETAFGEECPDGSNCNDAGDLLCDTAADPDLDKRVNDSCMYTWNGTRCGQSFNPDPRNLMSYSVKECRDVISPEQVEKALATLINQRGNLLGAQLSVTWVDFYADSGVGTYNDPINNVGQALDSTMDGGRIVFKPSSVDGAYTLSRPMTLDSFRGTVTIGRR
jgi:hypothetical protein